jgi:CheY-like chemotaxis protein
MKTKSVLVVDDDPITLKAIADGLERFGFLVHEAECAEAALELLEHVAGVARTLDFLVTDLNMPGMDGLNLIQTARKMMPTLQAVLMTGTDLEKAKQGIYPAERIKEYTRNYQRSGGRESFSSYYHSKYDSVIMRTDLKGKIVFAGQPGYRGCREESVGSPAKKQRPALARQDGSGSEPFNARSGPGDLRPARGRDSDRHKASSEQSEPSSNAVVLKRRGLTALKE